MAQDRMLRQSTRLSEKVNSWPIPLRYFWTQLWGYCDDHGRGRYDARLIVADTFPIDDEVTAEVVGRWMQALKQAGVIRTYEVGGKKYFECVNWGEHQELPYRKKTDIPDSDGVVPPPGKHSEKVQNVPENSRLRGREKKRSKREGEDPEPPRKCSIHTNFQTPPKCGQCADARQAHDAWRLRHIHDPLVPSSVLRMDPVCPHDRPLTVRCDICENEAAT